MIVTNPFSPGSLTRETINTVASGWWVLLLSGIVGVVAGGIILFTDWTVSQLVTFVGLLFIFRGVLTAVSLPVDGSMRGWALAVGLSTMVYGVVQVILSFELKNLPRRLGTAASPVTSTRAAA